MKVFHFILGKANKDRANGVNQVIAGLAKYSARNGAEVRVIGKAESADAEGEIVHRDGFDVRVYSRWSTALAGAVKDAVRWADVVHLHGTYAPWNFGVAALSRSVRTPHIITLHDGLAPERAERGKVKKRAYDAVIQRRHLSTASAIHVLTQEEGTDLLRFAPVNHVFCVPNGIDLEDYPRQPILQRTDLRHIGYLGRLSPEKNLDALCSAFVAVNGDRKLRLLLAGPVNPYGESLRTRYGQHGVELVGPKYGTEKTQFIRDLDLFVHPSLCDVFSIAAMEVLALGTPLLITRTSKVSYFADRCAFMMCEPTSYGLAAGLRDALSRKDQWPVISENGMKLISETLNWDVSASKLLNEYEAVIARNDEEGA
ncbi:glycosyltransferase family 4 protein [Ramlibacter ginsenosidimutans]|uniref:Glycosyltransferase family 4 protein n=1 Tax=Ramlibacter ginsenosidimutans TaxID=502333 RepID=A0A934TSA2_9BURK|nr:glycosyltransferase family 4 protein [Ramlibacter ginsenosidimutans]MBK6006671.1 glycosyltransferase family 4 protein [Ramlibacter ginsenosidimutans]